MKEWGMGDGDGGCGMGNGEWTTWNEGNGEMSKGGNGEMGKGGKGEGGTGEGRKRIGARGGVWDVTDWEVEK